MRKVIVVSSLLLLAACGQGAPEQAAQAPVEAAPARDAVDPGTIPAAGAGFEAARLKAPLPEGMELPFPYHRLNENTVATDASRPERRVFVEVRQVVPDEAEAALTALLLQEGFSAPEISVAGSVRELRFSRADGAKVTAKINSRHVRPKAPDATGTVHLVWQSS